MSKILTAALIAGVASIPLVATAQAKGCIKGAIVGGVAGHMAGHGKMGAAGGCAVGHHMASKKAKDSTQSSDAK